MALFAKVRKDIVANTHHSLTSIILENKGLPKIYYAAFYTADESDQFTIEDIEIEDHHVYNDEFSELFLKGYTLLNHSQYTKQSLSYYETLPLYDLYCKWKFHPIS